MIKIYCMPIVFRMIADLLSKEAYQATMGSIHIGLEGKDLEDKLAKAALTVFMSNIR